MNTKSARPALLWVSKYLLRRGETLDKKSPHCAGFEDVRQNQWPKVWATPVVKKPTSTRAKRMTSKPMMT